MNTKGIAASIHSLVNPTKAKKASKKGRSANATGMKPRETDLYQPIKSLLESQGYEVKGEIHQCDVVARRGDETPVVVELKLSLNIGLLMQAVDRFAVTDKVYVAVPMNCAVLNTQAKRIRKLLRMLGLGLISIDTQRARQATVLLDPAPYKPRKSLLRSNRLLGEFTRRIGDPNPGGSDRRRGLMTAYRQRALRIASHLESHGQTKASQIASLLNEPKARNILYDNVYGWFDGHGAGQYTLSVRGSSEIGQWLEHKGEPVKTTGPPD